MAELVLQFQTDISSDLSDAVVKYVSVCRFSYIVIRRERLVALGKVSRVCAMMHYRNFTSEVWIAYQLVQLCALVSSRSTRLCLTLLYDNMIRRSLWLFFLFCWFNSLGKYVYMRLLFTVELILIIWFINIDFCWRDVGGAVHCCCCYCWMKELSVPFQIYICFYGSTMRRWTVAAFATDVLNLCWSRFPFRLTMLFMTNKSRVHWLHLAVWKSEFVDLLTSLSGMLGFYLGLICLTSHSSWLY